MPCNESLTPPLFALTMLPSPVAMRSAAEVACILQVLADVCQLESNAVSLTQAGAITTILKVMSQHGADSTVLSLLFRYSRV